ncbi:DUF506 family protein [Citrus sinensis]|uniref:DUF506 family protein n=1 Tax=Citrus sinensis TaxID=2711 RepID=A0ACB8NJP9_CITSI|nr:DUF506 family protein [Citrus sinensis]
MAKIPVRFKRVAAAFDEVAKVRICESSGSEHSPLPESFTDLSHLVNCFIEKDGVVVDEKNNKDDEDEDEGNDSEMGSYWRDSEKKEMLQGLFFGRQCDDQDHDDKRRIREETEFACTVLGDASSPAFKRRLMSHLRDKGFDAGLCKSRWEKTAKFPCGNYEFVDVNLGANRYIIEVNLAAQFEIARATDGYMSLVNLFPPIFVGKPGTLRQILRLMCGAARESIKSAELSVPPWRRNGYMQAKWFSPYKRTTNSVASTLKFEGGFASNRSIGFVTLQVSPYNCRDNFASKAGLKFGQLTAAFSHGGDDMGN